MRDCFKHFCTPLSFIFHSCRGLGFQFSKVRQHNPHRMEYLIIKRRIRRQCIRINRMEENETFTIAVQGEEHSLFNTIMRLDDFHWRTIKIDRLKVGQVWACSVQCKQPASLEEFKTHPKLTLLRPTMLSVLFIRKYLQQYRKYAILFCLFCL